MLMCKFILLLRCILGTLYCIMPKLYFKTCSQAVWHNIANIIIMKVNVCFYLFSRIKEIYTYPLFKLNVYCLTLIQSFGRFFLYFSPFPILRNSLHSLPMYYLKIFVLKNYFQLFISAKQKYRSCFTLLNVNPVYKIIE